MKKDNKKHISALTVKISSISSGFSHWLDISDTLKTPDLNYDLLQTVWCHHNVPCAHNPQLAGALSASIAAVSKSCYYCVHLVQYHYFWLLLPLRSATPTRPPTTLPPSLPRAPLLRPPPPLSVSTCLKS